MSAQRTVRVWMAGLLVLAGLGVSVGALYLTSSPAAADDAAAATADPLSGVESENAAPLEVTVGFYAANLQGLDQQDSSYYADFFMWMRWRGALDPTATVEFTNNIERWGLTMAKVYDEPKLLPSGELIQSYRVQGKFFQPLDLSDYPLDSHSLTLIVEDTTYAEDELVYVADTVESGLDREVALPGWNVTGWQLPVEIHSYDTGFGEGIGKKSAQSYSAAVMEISISRPVTFFLWKLLLPLIIVLVLACSVLFVHPSFTEVRLAAPATALLALVFLQQSYSSTLPEIGKLVLLDKIYALAYLVIIVLILTMTLTSYWVRDGSAEKTARAIRLDHWAAFGSVTVVVLGSGLLVATAI